MEERKENDILINGRGTLIHPIIWINTFVTFTGPKVRNQEKVMNFYRSQLKLKIEVTAS